MTEVMEMVQVHWMPNTRKKIARSVVKKMKTNAKTILKNMTRRTKATMRKPATIVKTVPDA